MRYNLRNSIKFTPICCKFVALKTNTAVISVQHCLVRFGGISAELNNKSNGFSQKIVPKFSENFRKIWQYKFSKMAFLAKTAGNGVWDLVGDANSDPMVYKSSKSAFWKRKIQFSVKIRKFGTISCESPLQLTIFIILIKKMFSCTKVSLYRK